MDQNINKRIYMDYQATTPLAEEVCTAIESALKTAWGNPSSHHKAGVSAKKLIDSSRKWIAKMISANHEDIIFNSGGTEGNNTVIHCALQYFHEQVTNEPKHKMPKLEDKSAKKRLPHIITSNVEHDSVVNVLQHFEKNGLAEVTYVPVSHKTGRVEVDDVLKAVQPNTCLVTIMLANNETGILMPIKEISEAIREHKQNLRILIHTDAAQAIGKIPVNVQDLDVDFLTIVGHKFYGPRIGALYVKGIEEGKTPYTPMFYGGGQERNYRSGTENTPMIAGLGKAAELVCKHIDEYESHQERIRDYLEEQIIKTFGDQVCFNAKFKETPRLPSVCNMSLKGTAFAGKSVHDRCERLLASVGAACHSGGKHRASHILLNTGIPEEIAVNAVRLSVGRQTSEEDIDIVVEDIKQAIDSLKTTP